MGHFVNYKKSDKICNWLFLLNIKHKFPLALMGVLAPTWFIFCCLKRYCINGLKLGGRKNWKSQTYHRPFYDLLVLNNSLLYLIDRIELVWFKMVAKLNYKDKVTMMSGIDWQQFPSLSQRKIKIPLSAVSWNC